MKSKYSYLDATRLVHEGLKGKKLALTAIRNVRKDLNAVMDFFNTTESNAVVLSSIVQTSLIEGEVEMGELVKHFGSTTKQLPQICQAVDELREAGLVFRVESIAGQRKRRIAPFSFVMDALIKNDRAKIQPKTITLISDVLTEYCKLQNLRNRNNITHAQFFQQVVKLCDRSEHLEAIRYIKTLRLSTAEVVILLYMADATFRGIEMVDINLILGEVTSDASDFYEWRGKIRNQELALFKEGLVEFGFLDLGIDSEIGLTMNARDQLFINDPRKLIHMFRPQHCKLMLPENVAPVDLVFDPHVVEQLAGVRNSLEPANYSLLSERLKAKNLRGGLVVLFHGSPGTGKTESVYQLARNSGRVVLRVEMSQIKSMWVGDSEKNIKKVFNEYRQSLRKFDNHPILLFNEADAIFSRRRNVGSSVDQMDNAMQNILLQELEEFEGILIATTNLTQNMDTAFERRFLYKVKFESPGMESRLKLLSTNFGQLPENDRKAIASTYAFTGSTLESIRRKLALREILEPSEPTSEELRKMILEECKLGGEERKPIGFRISSASSN
jgi:hypothetical protein